MTVPKNLTRFPTVKFFTDMRPEALHPNNDITHKALSFMMHTKTKMKLMLLKPVCCVTDMQTDIA